MPCRAEYPDDYRQKPNHPPLEQRDVEDVDIDTLCLALLSSAKTANETSGTDTRQEP